MIKIRFSCGHEGQLSDSIQTTPVCPCGERQIAFVQPSRPPRFVGTCSGPYAEFKALDPGIVNVAPSGPLKLKDPSDART